MGKPASGYRQVELYHPFSGQRMVCWLPVDFAVEGAFLRLRDDNGWTVTHVHKTPLLSHEVLQERSQDYKHTRKASDI